MIQNLNMGLPYAFPPSISIRVILKIKQEWVLLLILIASASSTRPWYPERLNLCVKEPVMLPQEKRNSHKPEKCYLSTDDGELIETSGLIDFKKTLLFEGISENTFHVITNSRRKGTLSNYESAWRKWASWCPEQKIDHFQAPVKNNIEYLTFLFNYGNEYWTINFHRSAISTFHEYIKGLPVGKYFQWYLMYLI